MANDIFTGPVDYVVYGFPASASVGVGLQDVLERVDQGLIEILDIEYVTVDESGAPVASAVADLQGTSNFDLSVFNGALSGLLDSDDLVVIADSLDQGWFAIAVVYEDRSLAKAGGTWAKAGGKELLTGGIDIQQLADVLD